jgi:outer membrane protein TolC
MRRGRSQALAVALLVAMTSPLMAEKKIPIPSPRPARISESQDGQTQTETKRPTGARITLADAVFLGLRNNRSIRSAHIERIAEKFDLRVAENGFRPHWSISGEFARQSVGDVTSTALDVSPGVTLATKTGAVFDFAWNNAARITEGGRSWSSTAEIGVEQPLLRGAGATIATAPLEQARLGEAISRLRLKATVAETIATIIFAHRELFLAQEEETLAKTAVERSKALLAVNRALIAAGRMAAMEAVQTEADLEGQRLRVLQAKQQIEANRLALLNLLGLDLDARIEAVEAMSLKRIKTDPERLVATALALRPDYQGQLNVIEQNRLGLTVARNEQLWDIALFARGRLGREFETGGSSRTVSDVVGGLRFTFPIDDVARQQLLVDADATHRNSELQLEEIRAGVDMQIRSSAAEVDLLWQQIDIARRSRDLAAKAVDIERTRLNVGRSTTFQVRSLEDQLRGADNALLAARVGYLNALTRLDLQMGTTLETWKIDLRD